MLVWQGAGKWQGGAGLLIRHPQGRALSTEGKPDGARSVNLKCINKDIKIRDYQQTPRGVLSQSSAVSIQKASCHDKGVYVYQAERLIGKRHTSGRLYVGRLPQRTAGRLYQFGMQMEITMVTPHW